MTAPEDLATLRQRLLVPADPCPRCGFAGPHHPLDTRWVECGRDPISMGPHTWTGGCGATWQTSFDGVIARPDRVADRVIDLLDASTDIEITDCLEGHTVLTWKTTLELALRIAADSELRARIIDATGTPGVRKTDGLRVGSTERRGQQRRRPPVLA
jgi:hypothetical protein